MAHLKRLVESRPWHTLIPDQFSPKPWFELEFANEKRVVVDGLGEQRGLDFLAAAYTADRNTLIAYIPTGRTVTVDLSRLAGETRRGWWFNPRDGSTIYTGAHPGQGLLTLKTPSSEDWVLVIDNADINLPAPGEKMSS